jgi:hypothetical protein
MEEPGKLNDLFDSYNSENSDPRLHWSEMGPKINAALQEKKKKKRFLWWPLFGVWLALIVVVGYSSLINSKEKMHLAPVSTDNKMQVDIIKGQYTDFSKSLEKEKPFTNQASPALALKEESTIQNNIQQPKNRNILKKSIMQDANPVDIKSDNSADRVNTSIEPTTNTTHHQEKVAGSSDSFFDIQPGATSDETKFIPSLISKVIITKQQLSSFYIKPFQKIKPIKNSTTSIYTFSGINFNNLHKKHSNSTALKGTSIEMGIEKKIKDNFFVSLGLGIEQNRFQTSFEQVKPIEIYKPQTIDTIYNYRGENEEVIYTDYVDGLGIRSFGHTNKVTTAMLPLHVGYKFEIGKLIIAPQLGIVLTLHQQTRFEIANHLYEIQSRVSSHSWSMHPLFRGAISMQLPLSIHSAIALRYNITAQSIHPWSENKREQYLGHGIQIGYQYRL